MQLRLKPDYSFFIVSSSTMASTSSLGPSTLLSYASSSRQFPDFGFRLILGHESVRFPSFQRFRIHCKSKEKEVRLSSPVLESSSLSGGSALRSNEWKAVPDIWRSSAEKFGDRVALVDPYHDPPLKLTYKELEQEILDFAEGLRVLGVKADEKIALFADNSCRWLVSDQGIMATGAVNVVRGSRSSVEELLQIYHHSESVALVVDNSEFFNRIAESFTSKASLRFLILLWGEKSSLVTQGMQIPVYTYAEIKNQGQESRAKLSGSNDTRSYRNQFINSDDTAAIMTAPASFLAKRVEVWFIPIETVMNHTSTRFARKDAGAVTLKELCLLYQGLKHLLIDMRGVLLEYEFGDEINYGSIFASNLLQFRKWAETTPNPDLYIGGMLTPLFEKAGVDLSNSRELPDMAYLGRDYLITSRFLKATSDLNALHYKIQLRDKTKRIFVLPQPDKTNILTLTNVKFEVGEEDLLQEDQGPMGLGDSDGEGAAEPRDYLEELNMIQMPDIEFTARTKREKLIQAAYKAQRKKINEIQKKLLAKLFRKVKKLQPPDYVSSEDEDE